MIIINYRQLEFNFELISVSSARRSEKFLVKYRACGNVL